MKFIALAFCAATASAEAYYGNYGYSGLAAGYGGAYTTGLRSYAAPVYGYNTPAYTTGYGYGKRSADAEADAEAYYGNYGYSGLATGYGAGYGGAYTTGLRSYAAPVYGYARTGYG